MSPGIMQIHVSGKSEAGAGAARIPPSRPERRRASQQVGLGVPRPCILGSPVLAPFSRGGCLQSHPSQFLEIQALCTPHISSPF